VFFSGSHSSLINRHREQARSYSGLSTFAKSGRLFGRHRGRALLPQWVEYIREIRSAVRPPSRASLAPTMGRVHSRNQVGCQAAIAGKPCSHNGSSTFAKSGRLLGRHRGQALLPQWIWCISGISFPLSPPSSKHRQQLTVAPHHSRPSVSSPSPFTTRGRALARLQAFDLDLAFDLPAPSGGRVEVFIWGAGAKRRAAKPHTSRGGRREADRRRCPQMNTGAREHRA